MTTRALYSGFKSEPDILTVPDVIRLLCIGKNTVYKLIQEGAIKSIRRGKKIIVPKVCLIAFLEAETHLAESCLTVSDEERNDWTNSESYGNVRTTQRSQNAKKP